MLHDNDVKRGQLQQKLQEQAARMCEESQRNQAQLQDLLQTLADTQDAMTELEKEKNLNIEELTNQLHHSDLHAKQKDQEHQKALDAQRQSHAQQMRDHSH